MPSTQREQMARQAGSIGRRPMPPIPKIPDEIKNRHPENKPFWDAYDFAWEEFFKKQTQRST